MVDPHLAGQPRVGEQLLLEQLEAYRGTDFHRKALNSLAALAPKQPALLTPPGWAEVALGLLGLGDEMRARALLRGPAKDYFTFEGLQAELALRRGDYPAAAELMADGGYLLHDEQLYALMVMAPRALLPFLGDCAAWVGAPDDHLHIASYSEALDKAGAHRAAEAAAREMLARARMKDRTRASNRVAQLEARLGHLREASRQLDAPRDERGTILQGIVIGLALRGDGPALAATIEPLSPVTRTALLRDVRAGASGAPAPLRDWAAARLAAWLHGNPSQVVSAAWIAEAAKAGTDEKSLIAILRATDGRKSRAALALAAAGAAAEVGRNPSALALADEARRQIGDPKIVDETLVLLTRIYWSAGDGETAAALAARVRDPAEQVRAWTQIVWSRDKEVLL